MFLGLFTLHSTHKKKNLQKTNKYYYLISKQHGETESEVLLVSNANLRAWISVATPEIL